MLLRLENKEREGKLTQFYLIQERRWLFPWSLDSRKILLSIFLSLKSFRGGGWCLLSSSLFFCLLPMILFFLIDRDFSRWKGEPKIRRRCLSSVFSFRLISTFCTQCSSHHHHFILPFEDRSRRHVSHNPLLLNMRKTTSLPDPLLFFLRLSFALDVMKSSPIISPLHLLIHPEASSFFRM